VSLPSLVNSQKPAYTFFQTPSAAGLRHPDDAGQARAEGRRGSDAYQTRRLAEFVTFMEKRKANVRSAA
jgi:hypothetical protein